MSRVGDTIVLSTGLVPLPDALSDSERAVVRAVLAGQTNSEIASARGTSSKTVANQLYAIYRKLRVGSRDELAACLAYGNSGALEKTSGVDPGE